MKKPRILIDANPVVQELVTGKVDGIGRTCRELIMSIDAMRNNLPVDISLYTQNVKGVSAERLGTGFRTVHSYLRNIESHNRLAARLRLREIFGRYDLQHITHNYEIVRDPSRCIVTVHDVMFFSYPEKQVSPEFYRRMIPPFLRKARHIITISENSKREIIKYINIPEDKITVIPWGINHDILKPHKVNGNRWCGDRPYFISVSCDTGRKNTISLVKAFIDFAKNDPLHELVLVWREPSDEVLTLIDRNAAVKGKIHFASNISDMELSDLYAGATASFFPSLYEGFGLPILESMACGTPCVTASNSSLAEVGGDAALYVNPLCIEEMLQIMEAFENDTVDMESLRNKSIIQASKFTWRKCAEATLGVYMKNLGSVP